MKVINKLEAIKALIGAKLFMRRTPFLISWEITERCNAQCGYCNIWRRPSTEMETSRALALVKELARLGTRMIHFTGGEPLLREDIGVILDCCRRQGISTSVNSNGFFVSERIHALSSLDLLGISLDGPEGTHDLVRGKGSYKGAMSAMEVARERGIELRLLTILARHNLGCIDFLIEKAEKFKAPIFFQPATELLLGGAALNPLAPDVEEYRRLIDKLIAKKKSTRFIANSLSGLKFLSEWPRMRKIRCRLNLISCRIQSDGHVFICFRNQFGAGKIGEGGASVKDAFLGLATVDCSRCCCASSVEMNCLLSFKLDVLFNSLGLL